MRVTAACAALVTAAVVGTIAGDAVVTADRLASLVGALLIAATGAAQPDRSAAGRAASGAANRRADVAGALQTATAVRPGVARSTFVPAAVERAVTGDAIVRARDRATVLVAFTRGRTLTAKAYRASTRSGAVCADAALAPHVAAALGVRRAGPAPATAAIQDAGAVVGAGDGAIGLAALTSLRAPFTWEQSGRAVIDAAAFNTVEATAAVSAIAHPGAAAAFVPAAVERAVTVIPVVPADGAAARLSALIRRRALCS